MRYLILSLVFGMTSALSAQCSFGFAVRAEVSGGTLEGCYDTKSGVQKYLGVPFAAPPVGELRWRAPQVHGGWAGVREAKSFGPRPVQKFLYDDMVFRSPSVSEDCLYLNVWTPMRKGDDDLAVLLYFNGGGNTTGSGDEIRYDGERLAREENIIVVTANYRLGVFGFLAHTQLSAEAEYGGSGNYGLLDQQMAIRWVRENIGAFGGNPEKITIGGESAGSIDVSCHMTSPLSRELIAGAIGQSGAAINPTFTPVPLAEAEATGAEFLARTGYASIAQLRAAPTRDIYEAFAFGPSLPLRPVIDGYFLTEQLPETFRAGKQAQIPLLVGWTSAEMAWLPAPEGPEAYEASLRSEFPDQADALLEAYPSSDAYASLLQLRADRWIVYSTWKWAELHAENSEAPVYRYRFDRIRPPLVGQDRPTPPPGAGHATDIEYFFDNLHLATQYQWTAADRETAAQIRRYVGNFVRQGDPNSLSGDIAAMLPFWRRMDKVAGERQVMHLDSTVELRVAEREGRFATLGFD